MIAVFFEADIQPAQQQRYLLLAAQLKPLLAEIEGFIAIERFQSLATQGKILSLSWWRDEAAVLAWKNNVLHQAAQEEGKSAIFSAYRIRIASVFRDYQRNNEGQSCV